MGDKGCNFFFTVIVWREFSGEFFAQFLSEYLLHAKKTFIPFHKKQAWNQVFLACNKDWLKLSKNISTQFFSNNHCKEKLMRPNKVETALQCFCMLCISVHWNKFKKKKYNHVKESLIFTVKFFFFFFFCRERRNLERLTSLDMDRGRDKDRTDRYREAERRRSRSRSRSPIRNGRLEPPKQDLIDKRHDDKSSLKIKEERREEDVHLLERDKLLRNNDYLFASLPHTAATMPVNMLERARMLGPRYYNNERPQLGVWNPYDKSFDMSHRLELREIERERDHMIGSRFNPNDLYFRERMFDRMPIFDRERYEYEANKLPPLRPVDPLSVGHFPRTVSPMVNHSSKSNSPASIPGAPPPLIPSSSTSHPRSHTNSPASSKSKASSPLDNVSELKDKRDTHSSSTDPDTHSR